MKLGGRTCLLEGSNFLIIFLRETPGFKVKHSKILLELNNSKKPREVQL